MQGFISPFLEMFGEGKMLKCLLYLIGLSYLEFILNFLEDAINAQPYLTHVTVHDCLLDSTGGEGKTERDKRGK